MLLSKDAIADVVETLREQDFYRPAHQRTAAAESALRRLVRTFFDGSVANAVSGLLSLRDQTLTTEEIARLEKMIAETKKEESP